MTSIDLEIGLAACAAATPLPWIHGGDWMRSDGPFSPDFPDHEIVRLPDGSRAAFPVATKDSRSEDVHFLVTATAQYPTLLRVIMRLRETAQMSALELEDVDRILAESSDVVTAQQLKPWLFDIEHYMLLNEMKIELIGGVVMIDGRPFRWSASDLTEMLASGAVPPNTVLKDGVLYVPAQ